jgi:hypothetical protein
LILCRNSGEPELIFPGNDLMIISRAIAPDTRRLGSGKTSPLKQISRIDIALLSCSGSIF